MPTVARILQVSPVAQYLASNYIAKKNIIGDRALDNRLPITIYMVYVVLKKIYDNDSSYPGLQVVADYLWELIGRWGIIAEAIVDGNTGGSIAGITTRQGVIWIRITSADFANATDYVNEELQGVTFFLDANWVTKILEPETDWEYLPGGGFRILLDGFDATAADYEFYLVKRNLSSALANNVDWSNISGKPLEGLAWDLSADTLITNPATSMLTNFQEVIYTIKPNGYNYTWDTKFTFGFTWPEQPTATGANTMQIYTFNYIASEDKLMCTGQAIDILI